MSTQKIFQSFASAGVAIAVFILGISCPRLALSSDAVVAQPVVTPTANLPPPSVAAPAAPAAPTESLTGSNPSPVAPVPVAPPPTIQIFQQGAGGGGGGGQPVLALPPGFNDNLRSHPTEVDRPKETTGSKDQKYERTATVLDEIMVDYLKSKSFAEFMRRMGPKVLPGDDVFLGQKVYSNPALLKVKRLPVLIFESETIYIRTARGEVGIRPLDLDTGMFEVNHQRLSMPSYSNAGARWNKMSDAMILPTEASWFSFLPVAFAVENGNAPTISSLMAFSIISRISRAMSHLTARIIVDKSVYPYTDMWKKSIEHKTSCSPEYLYRLAQKISEINVSSLTCNGTHPIFELPVNETDSRLFEVNVPRKRVTVTGKDLPEPLVLRRDFSMDQNLDYVIREKMRPDSESTPAEKTEFRRKFSALRMKGLKWKPMNDDKVDSYETGEHVRELANIIVSGNMCHRCGQFFKQAAKIIRQETDPDSLAVSVPSATPPVETPQTTAPAAPPPLMVPPSAAAASPATAPQPTAAQGERPPPPALPPPPAAGSDPSELPPMPAAAPK